LCHKEEKTNMKRKYDEVSNLCTTYEVPFSSIRTKLNSVEVSQEPTVTLGRIWRAQKKEDIPTKKNTLSIRVSKGQGHIGNVLSPFHLLVSPWQQKEEENILEQKQNILEQKQQIFTKGQIPLEMWWQAAKVKPSEVGEGGVVLPCYFERRQQIFTKGQVKRRYFTGPIAGAVFGDDPKLVDYLSSRVWYCKSYSQAVENLPAFKFLKAILQLGINLLLLGPDGHQLQPEETWEQAYSDPTKQFGHERVLACMLSIHDSTLWPWNH
jgi:hypothetical protein